jgi:hypothetical protein
MVARSRPLPLLLSAAVLLSAVAALTLAPLVALAASAPAAAPRASSISSSSSSSKSPVGANQQQQTCPDAQACGIATQQDVAATTDALFRYFGASKIGAALIRLGDDGKSCEVSSTDGYYADCEVRGQGTATPWIEATLACPQTFVAATATTCVGAVHDERGPVWKLPLVGGGTQQGSASCAVSLVGVKTPFPKNQYFEVEISARCAQDVSILEGAGAKSPELVKKALAPLAAQANQDLPQVGGVTFRP